MYLGNVCISVPQKFLNLLEKSYRRISARWQNRAFQHLSLHRWKKEKKKKKNNVKNIYGWKCLHEGSGIHLKGYSTKVDDRGWDGWITSPTWWTWVWVNSGSWWWTGRPGVLYSWGHKKSDMTKWLNWTDAYIEAGGIWEIFVPSYRFCCELKIALKFFSE